MTQLLHYLLACSYIYVLEAKKLVLKRYWPHLIPLRKPWSDHKENKNLHPQVLAWGPVSQTPDWSYAETGDPGALNEKQINLRDENIRLAKEIFEAAQLVLKAKEFEKK